MVSLISFVMFYKLSEANIVPVKISHRKILTKNEVTDIEAYGSGINGESWRLRNHEKGVLPSGKIWHQLGQSGS